MGLADEIDELEIDEEDYAEEEGLGLDKKYLNFNYEFKDEEDWWGCSAKKNYIAESNQKNVKFRDEDDES